MVVGSADFSVRTLASSGNFNLSHLSKAPMSATSSAPFSPEEIVNFGLKPEEYEEVVQRLGRHPNKAELGMLAACGQSIAATKNHDRYQAISHYRLLHSRGTGRKRRCSRLGRRGCDWHLS